MAVSAGQEEGTVNLRVYGVAAHRIIHRTALAGNDPLSWKTTFVHLYSFLWTFSLLKILTIILVSEQGKSTKNH